MNTAEKSRRSKVILSLWVVALILFICGAIGIIAVCLLHAQKSQLPYNYGIGIDAGSSRTDFYVYRWPTGKENGTGIAEQIYKCPSGSDKKLPSLSSLAQSPGDAGALAIRPCMDRILSNNIVPSTDYSTTPVFMGATAGMRVLRAADERAADDILASVRSALTSYPFRFTDPLQQARIINGSEEGAFGWVTSNYLAGSFGVLQQKPSTTRSPTVGALDMGGASTQMTFEPDSPETGSDDDDETIQLFGYTYNVYAHSYLCYGFDEANRKYKALLIQAQNFSQIIDDPCAPLGNQSFIPFSTVFREPCTSSANLPAFAQKLVNSTDYFQFRGTSNSEQCRNLTRGIFNTSAPCTRPPCTFNGVYQPNVDGQFLAFSGYYFSVSDIGLDPNKEFTLDEFRTAIDRFCSKTWAEVSTLGKPDSIAIILCFQNQHAYHMLVDMYGFNTSTWQNIKFVSKINDNDFGWVLGMMLNATNTIPSHEYTSPVNDSLFIPLLLTFSSLILISFLAGVLAFFWSRKHKAPVNAGGNENQSFYGT